MDESTMMWLYGDGYAPDPTAEEAREAAELGR